MVVKRSLYIYVSWLLDFPFNLYINMMFYVTISVVIKTSCNIIKSINVLIAI